METILENSIQLSCLIRDSFEGQSWRNAKVILDQIPIDGTKLRTHDNTEKDIINELALINRSNRVRPLMLPLLLNMYLPTRIVQQFHLAVSQKPPIARAYKQLEQSTIVTSIIVEYLRSIVPGYPHNELIYTLPNTVWRDLSTFKEVPWKFTPFNIPNTFSNAHQIGLEKLFSQSAKPVLDALDSLVKAIKAGEMWYRLEKSHQALNRRHDLHRQLQVGLEEYKKQISKHDMRKLSKFEWYSIQDETARKIYLAYTPRIKNFVNNYLEYEQLLENVYWLLSQIVMFEFISCISSLNSKQIQQISLSRNDRTIITAITRTQARTLSVGQLFHVTLPDIDHLGDGIYQVESIRQRYSPASGTYTYFRARCLWPTKLDRLIEITRSHQNKTFHVESEHSDMDKLMVQIKDNNNNVVTLEAGQYLNLDFSATMYIP